MTADQTLALLDVHCIGLQTQLEAAGRCAVLVTKDATELRERLLGRHLEQAALTGALTCHVRELVDCLQEQRGLLADLRTEMHRLRQQLQARRRGAAAE